MPHLTPYIKHGQLKSDNTLHVIGVIENPQRYHSRYRLFSEWHETMLRTPNVKVIGKPEFLEDCREYMRHRHEDDVCD